jgi:hypothetical protein
MKEFPKFKVTIKGDAGIYKVYIIDWWNRRIYIDRTCMNEWVSFDKIKKIMMEEEITNGS